jgi:DNA polymerase-3 subunit delta
MDPNGLKATIKSGRLGGAYLFFGEERYLVNYYFGQLRSAAVADDTLSVFNNPRYHGEELDFASVLEELRSPPMMSDYKLIECHGVNFAKMREGDLELLDEVLESVKEHPYAVVAFVTESEWVPALFKGKRPTAFMQRFGERMNVLQFDKSTENQLYSWLKKHFEANGLSVTLDTVKALVFRSGRSMTVLASEVEKLSALAHARGRSAVTPDDVDEVASGTIESDTFALSNALLDRNREGAYEAVFDLKSRRVDPVMVFGMISRTYTEALTVANLLDDGMTQQEIVKQLNMNEFRVRLYIAAAGRYGAMRLSEIVSDLTRADAGSKYGGISGYTAIEIFISKTV